MLERTFDDEHLVPFALGSYRTTPDFVAGYTRDTVAAIRNPDQLADLAVLGQGGS